MIEQCRSAGVLLHVTSLPSRYGCGSFGKEAKTFIDYLKKAGFRYWQILPYTIPDEFASPYSAGSSYFGNPLCIDLETLQKEELISEDDLDDNVVDRSKTNLRELFNERMEFFHFVWDRLENAPDENETVANLKKNIADYLDKHTNEKKTCEFFTLKELNDNADWQKWTITKDQAETDAKLSAKYESAFRFYAFLSYEFDKQWSEIKSYANDNFVRIIGDVPIYVNLQSADVYYNQECFQLGKDGYPTHVSGIPKCKNEEGQKWGHPLYNVRHIRDDDYRFVLNRFSHALRRFDLIRIDHFKGFASYGSIPVNEGPDKGKWIKDDWINGKLTKAGLGEECLQKIIDKVGQNRLIAEDVGAENDRSIQNWLRDYRIPGMKIVQFDDNIDNYGDSVAYTGTHDNNTIMGYLNNADDDFCEKIANKNGIHYTDRQALAINLIKKLFASRARIVIIPAQDLLLQDSSARMNIPGSTEESNWMYALTSKDMEKLDADAEKISNLLAANTHNKIKILKNDNVSIRDFFGEIIITYYSKDEKKCTELFAKLDAQGCRYYKNPIDEVIIRNSEYEGRLDKRLEKCSRMILALSNDLLKNPAVMRLVWYQIGYVLPHGNRLLTFYLEEIDNYNLSGSPIGNLNLKTLKDFNEKFIYKNLVSSSVREKYFNDTSTNDYAVQKMHYKHVSLQLDIDAAMLKNANNNHYYESPSNLLRNIDVCCYLLAFSLDGVNVDNYNYSDELKQDRHTDYLTNDGIISKRYYRSRTDTEDKFCFIFDFLVPVHHPLGAIVKPYFVWHDDGNFDYFKNLIYMVLSPYEIMQRDLVADDNTKRIYFSFDFPLREITKDLNFRNLDSDKQEKSEIGTVVDMFYPQ